MASSSTITCNFHSSIFLPTSPTRFPTSFSPTLLCPYNGVSLRPTSIVRAKFEKFQGEPLQEAQDPSSSSSSSLENTQTSLEDEEEDDRYSFVKLRFIKCKMFCSKVCSRNWNIISPESIYASNLIEWWEWDVGRVDQVR